MPKHLRTAVAVALQSRCRHRHGCVVVRNGRVVATGVNKRVGDVHNAWRRSHIHAEIAGALSAGSQISGAFVYVARVLADGSVANSKPCKRCEAYLRRAGAAKIIWT